MTIDDLIAGATDRVVVHPEDGKSGASFEKLTLNGEAMFLKVLSYDTDWISRCHGNTDLWEFKTWQAGVYKQVPAEIDTAMVDMVVEDGRLAMLLRDISSGLIPEGDEPVSLEQHNRFMDHMAAFHAAFWGWTDDIGVASIESRLLIFSDENVAREMQVADPPVPIRVAQEGWALLPERSPRLHEIVSAIHADPSRLADEMRATPLTFIMGDWKMGNLGSHADGRTIVLDWAYPGAAPGCWDLVWYLALNRSRIPTSKEDSIAVYRAGLEARGIETESWFDRQLQLCLTGIMATMGWEKAVGDADELAWWEAAVTR